MQRDERGITGLETSIILIAFVVVASVFAYTVLSTGISSSQKCQEAVYTGLEQARSTLELKTEELSWTASPQGWGDSDDLLEAGEMFEITVDMTGAGEAIDTYHILPEV